MPPNYSEYAGPYTNRITHPKLPTNAVWRPTQCSALLGSPYIGQAYPAVAEWQQRQRESALRGAETGTMFVRL